MNTLTYFAASSDEKARSLGRLLAPVILYFVVLGVMRLLTKKPLTTKQKVVTAVVIISLFVLSAISKVAQNS
jgi:hypothetical protein